MDLHHRRCGASRPRPSGLRIAWGARSAGDRLRAGADNLVTSTLDLKCEGRLCGVLFVFSRVHAMRGTHIEGARSDNQRDRKITDNVVELPIEARAGLPIAGAQRGEHEQGYGCYAAKSCHEFNCRSVRTTFC